MNAIDFTRESWELNRGRTLATLDAVAALADPQTVLAWRAGPGRAHIGWQLAHIAVTEELFATKRLRGTEPHDPAFVERFRGGSTPDDDVPDVETLRRVLDDSRRHLLETVAQFDEADLDRVPDALREKGWTIRQALKVLGWHEPHHQGQAHLTLNLWKAAQPRQGS